MAPLVLTKQVGRCIRRMTVISFRLLICFVTRAATFLIWLQRSWLMLWFLVGVSHVSSPEHALYNQITSSKECQDYRNASKIIGSDDHLLQKKLTKNWYLTWFSFSSSDLLGFSFTFSWFSADCGRFLFIFACFFADNPFITSKTTNQIRHINNFKSNTSA